MNSLTKCSIIFLIFFGFFYINLAEAFSFTANANYKVCFSPAHNCTKDIVQEIDAAKNFILVEAYTFTSKPIAKALVRAHKNGIVVKLIVDKDQYEQNPYQLLFLKRQGISLWIDKKIEGIMHNKIIIIDDKKLITGSFNFTKAAEKYNAENVLIIEDGNLVQIYHNNWDKMLQESTMIL